MTRPSIPPLLEDGDVVDELEGREAALEAGVLGEVAESATQLESFLSPCRVEAENPWITVPDRASEIGIDQDVLVGTAKGTLTVTGSTTIMYWTFTPINFTSSGTALMVKIQSTDSLRIKAQNNFASGEWWQNDGGGQFGSIRTSRVSIGGTAIAPNVPQITSIIRSGTSTTVNWNLNGAASVDLERSTDLGGSDPWTKVLTGTTDTTYNETSSDPAAFFRLVSP